MTSWHKDAEDAVSAQLTVVDRKLEHEYPLAPET